MITPVEERSNGRTIDHLEFRIASSEVRRNLIGEP
jgi:hypothetical protein